MTELAENAGDDTGSGLPEGAFPGLRNDAGTTRYIGAAPPAGHGAVSPLLLRGPRPRRREPAGVPADATPAFLGFNIFGHILGRAVLTATAQID